MSSRHRHQGSTAVKDSSHHHHLTSSLKKLSISAHRHRPEEHKDDRHSSQSRHRRVSDDYRDDRYRASGKASQALSPVVESPSTEPSYNRHQDPSSQNQLRRTSTSSYRTITDIQHGSAIPNRHSYERQASELDDTSAPQSAHTSPRLRPPSLDGSASIVSSLPSLMSAQTRALPPVREMTFDEARVQLRGLQSRLTNLESAYSVSKYGPPKRNELKKFEKAAASLHRDCDFLIGREHMPVRNGLTPADALKGEVEGFWEKLLERLVWQKQQGGY